MQFRGNIVNVGDLDSPDRLEKIKKIISKKASLKKFYLDTYSKFATCLAACPEEGVALELGSGGGFIKDIIPNILTSDIIPYKDIDLVVDATAMQFANESLRTICMLNTLHHIPNAKAFFMEALRCLKPGGRIFIVDQYPGWLGYPILKWIHHEAFDPSAKEWQFSTDGPLSGANGALAWIIFERDKSKFETLFPTLKIRRLRTHSPLQYWLSGGLKEWSLIPEKFIPLVQNLDANLAALWPKLGCFLDIELEKIK